MFGFFSTFGNANYYDPAFTAPPVWIMPSAPPWFVPNTASDQCECDKRCPHCGKLKHAK